MPSSILAHILGAKFAKSARASVAGAPLTPALVAALVGHIVAHKYEQRSPSGDVHDEMLAFLSGEQESLMEISYTKQQQKQKQKQKSKDQDADTMEVFDKKNQLQVAADMDDYFAYTLAVRAPASCRK